MQSERMLAMKIVNPLKVIEKHWDKRPVPIYDIVREIGLQLEFLPLGPETSGYIERNRDDSYRVVVNANHAETRKRFTAAHELGHYIYHRDLLGNGVGDTRAYRSEGTLYANPKITPVHERQANTFAANILMPRHVLLAIPDRDARYAELAQDFGVSKAAMKIRLGVK